MDMVTAMPWHKGCKVVQGATCNIEACNKHSLSNQLQAGQLTYICLQDVICEASEINASMVAAGAAAWPYGQA